MNFNQLPPPILPDLLSQSALLPPPPQTTETPTAKRIHHPSFHHEKPQTPMLPHQHQQQQLQPQLPSLEAVIQELEEDYMDVNQNDEVVLTNAVCLLYTLSIDLDKGKEACLAMSASQRIMSRLYSLLTEDSCKNDELLRYAAAILTSISCHEEGRVALLKGHMESLICSLRRGHGDVVIFAITAIHNLLLDKRDEQLRSAKAQIKYGLEYMVKLLDNGLMMQNYEFMVIVCDCLYRLAYRDRENSLKIKQCGGSTKVLKIIKVNFDNPPALDLMEAANRALKSLSACPDNKIDIIANSGIDILTECLQRRIAIPNCLWTLRNLSDVINTYASDDHVESLVNELMRFLHDYGARYYFGEAVAYALGILTNLTCNNERVKQLCGNGGTELLLNTLQIAMDDFKNILPPDEYLEMLSAGLDSLCHIVNRKYGSPESAKEAKDLIRGHSALFQLPDRIELSKAVNKLEHLLTNY